MIRQQFSGIINEQVKDAGTQDIPYSFTTFVHTNATALCNTILHCEVMSYKVLTSSTY